MSLKSLRESLDMTQIELSKVLGVSQSRYSAIERQSNAMSQFNYFQLQSLADVSHMEIDDVIQVLNDNTTEEHSND